MVLHGDAIAIAIALGSLWRRLLELLRRLFDDEVPEGPPKRKPPWSPPSRTRSRCQALATGVLGVLLVPLLCGCEQQARGFALPPGDAERGREAFVALGCNACHAIADTVARRADAPADAANLTLGGTVTRVKTYGDLVTSIIHPSHRLSFGRSPATVTAQGESRMMSFNHVMTVQQLVDITTLLQASYSVWVPEYPNYRPHR